MKDELRPGMIYRHYKNKDYRVLGIARHSETLEELVLYETLHENELGRLWVRPKEMFLGFIEVEGERVRRFVPVEGVEGTNAPEE